MNNSPATDKAGGDIAVKWKASVQGVGRAREEAGLFNWLARKNAGQTLTKMRDRSLFTDCYKLKEQLAPARAITPYHLGAEFVIN